VRDKGDATFDRAQWPLEFVGHALRACAVSAAGNQQPDADDIAAKVHVVMADGLPLTDSPEAVRLAVEAATGWALTTAADKAAVKAACKAFLALQPPPPPRAAKPAAAAAAPAAAAAQVAGAEQPDAAAMRAEVEAACKAFEDLRLLAEEGQQQQQQLDPERIRIVVNLVMVGLPITCSTEAVLRAVRKEKGWALTSAADRAAVEAARVAYVRVRGCNI
jgi:hypothetical protein